MRLKIDDWGDPVLPEEMVDGIALSDLDEFYAGAQTWERPNRFLVLLTSYHRCFERGDSVRAVALHPLDEYKEWLELIERGS